MTASEFLTRHSFQTEYGKQKLEPEKAKLLHQVDKKIKEYRRSNETILKREMNISSEELKTIEKDFEESQGVEMSEGFRRCSGQRHEITIP